jgi:hypothetical protein
MFEFEPQPMLLSADHTPPLPVAEFDAVGKFLVLGPDAIDIIVTGKKLTDDDGGD